MGGLLFEGNVRLNQTDFLNLTKEIETRFKQQSDRKIQLIPFYRHKESFGDADFVVEKPKITDEETKHWFSVNQVHRNGDIVSFQYQNFQVDLVFIDSEHFDIAVHYFSWNDLGNLLGRIFKKTGFKFGHLGLSFIVQEGTWRFSEISVSQDIEKILSFVDLSPQEFLAGFETLNDIYNYVISSPYFNKDIYLLDNRSHTARIRDKKRPVYRNFLRWVADKPNLPQYPWKTMNERGGYVCEEEFLNKAFIWFPGFKQKYEEQIIAFDRAKLYKEKFNGNEVMRITGLKGPSLGHFMNHLRSLQTNIIDMTQDEISDWIVENYRKFVESRTRIPN